MQNGVLRNQEATDSLAVPYQLLGKVATMHGLFVPIISIKCEIFRTLGNSSLLSDFSLSEKVGRVHQGPNINLMNLVNLIKNQAFPETASFAGSTCAVIGNGSSILACNYGPVINSKDFVIRLNQARVKGYEFWVGSKTNLRILNLHCFSGINGIDCSENIATFSMFSLDIFSELNELTFLAKSNSDIEKARLNYPRLSINKITGETEAFCSALVGSEPTTGFIATMLALNFFDDVSLFGFDFYRRSSDHYYEKVRKYDRTTVHAINGELILLTHLANSGNLNFAM